MRLPIITHLEPENLDEALQLLDQYDDQTALLAGGSDLMVQYKNRTTKASHVIDLHKIKSLKYISYNQEEGLKLGATTTLLEIIRNDDIKNNYPALAQAAEYVGAFQHQSMGTIGGNLCLNTRCWFFNQSATWRKARPVCLKMGGEVCHVVPNSKECYASYCGDTAGILIAYQATATIVKNGAERTIPLEELYSGDGIKPIALARGEILTEIQVPAPKPGQAAVYLKLRERNAIDFPQVGVAVNTVWDNKTCVQAKLVLTAVAPKPVVVGEIEDILKGKEWGDPAVVLAVKEAATKAGKPVANMTGAVTHRKKMLGAMTQDALDKVAPSVN
jgi:4-hydroxybenzoyl-CoA reductase subunit beta